jgi:ketosteroid isomerase-like protein
MPRSPCLMKRIVLAFVSLVAISESHAGVNADAVIAAEKARGAALVAGDATRLADILSDDLRYIHSNGHLETKRVIVDDLAARKLVYERLVTSDLVPDEVTGDVVVLSGKIDQRKLANGRWSELKLLFQAVWRNEAGTWRIVNLQTVLPPQTGS